MEIDSSPDTNQSGKCFFSMAIYVCVYVSVYVYMYTFVFICVYVCIYVYVCLYMYTVYIYYIVLLNDVTYACFKLNWIYHTSLQLSYIVCAYMKTDCSFFHFDGHHIKPIFLPLQNLISDTSF